jgi:hypothetical protein
MSNATFTTVITNVINTSLSARPPVVFQGHPGDYTYPMLIIAAIQAVSVPLFLFVGAVAPKDRVRLHKLVEQEQPLLPKFASPAAAPSSAPMLSKEAVPAEIMEQDQQPLLPKFASPAAAPSSAPVLTKEAVPAEM